MSSGVRSDKLQCLKLRIYTLLVTVTNSRLTIKKKNKKSELISHETRDSISLIFTRRLSWSISSNFGENSLFKCASQRKIAKNSIKNYLSISRSFKVIDVGTPGKDVRTACYDKQQACVYLQPSSCLISRQ